MFLEVFVWILYIVLKQFLTRSDPKCWSMNHPRMDFWFATFSKIHDSL
jgi:hypothetical protein